MRPQNIDRCVPQTEVAHIGPTSGEIAAYSVSILNELAKMARGGSLTLLAHLCELAREEARSQIEPAGED